MKKSSVPFILAAAAAWANVSLAQGNGNGNGSGNGTNGNGTPPSHTNGNGNGTEGTNGNGTNGGSAGAALDFAALKAKCMELSGNQQMKAFKALVTCRDTRLVWREGVQQKPERFNLQNSREVGAAIKMKGFDMPYSGSHVDIPDTTAPCIVLDQWKVIVPAVDVELNCDELNEIDNLTTYCVGVVDERVQADPSQLVEEQTGERFNSCAQSSQASQGLSSRRGGQARAR